MEKTYQPERIEQPWYHKWEQAGYFAPTNDGPPYCIMLPPPNVTGTLHMGHGFQISLMDALIRYHRMQGNNTLWQVGTDHAGIATQMVVELQLAQEGKDRHALGRETFVERVWQWKSQSDGTIKGQLRRMGASVDWAHERFSLDEGLSAAVIEVFVRLYEEGLIYRGKRLVNWDPTLLTAISDLEVVSKEEAGTLWYIRYPLVAAPSYVTVATTRPETILGDVAVAVHPEDPRYQHLIGQWINLPLTDRQIPIIADASVVQEFGSGCVKITPAHDFNDAAMGERHHLSAINIFTPDAKMNDQAPAAYQGLDRFEARTRILADLTTEGLIEKTVPHQLNVPRGERSGVIIEPYLTNQWFIKAKPLAEPAIDVVKQGQIQFVPASWTKIYFQWLEQIQDWCISRQLWWGHRIPAWYDPDGKVYVGKSESEVRDREQLDANIPLRQDDDVLDTWFSASLWPFATLGWPENTERLATFYPTSVLVTGFDIIFFWVARMIMMGLKFKQAIPFKTVYITGLIRDREGQKMSKSKGNILDPIDLIDGISLDALLKKRTQYLMHQSDEAHIKKMTQEEFPNGIFAYGTDALRFTFYALASTGRDVRFDLGRIEGYRHFCNKLWNAARFALMQTEDRDLSEGPLTYSLVDTWIRNALQVLIDKVHHYFQQYRFDLLAQSLYEFVWNEYCDWYLELSKPILYRGDDPMSQHGTRRTLIEVLDTLLRLLHPLMPFITEEIWQRVAPLLGKTGASIICEPYPQRETTVQEHEVNEDIHWLKTLIMLVRNIRGEMHISPNKSIQLILTKGTPEDKARLNRTKGYIQTLAKIEEISFANTPPLCAATGYMDSLEVFIPLSGLIDKDSEIARLSKEITKLEVDLKKSKVKLDNPNYVAKAPPEVVAQEKVKTQEMETTLTKLLARLKMFEGLSI